MLVQAFYTGLSGMRSSGTAIDVVSDNIANANTVGFRSYDVEFSSLFEDMVRTSGNSSTPNNSIGMGSNVVATSMNMQDGSLQITDRSTDMAIYGDGWFGVQGNGEAVYTKAGDFSFDVNNDLVTQDGYHVMGTMGGNIKDGYISKIVDSIPLGDAGSQEQLNFPKDLKYPPEPTTHAQFMGNIGDGTTDVVMAAAVIDSQNNKNNLELTYTLAETQVPPGRQWDISATLKSLDELTIYDTQTGTASFDEYGALVSTTMTAMDNNGTTVDLDLGEGYEGIVSLSNTNLTASSVSNGTIGGDLMGYEININAEVIATFTNGMQSSVGKLAVYHFQNDQGLQRVDSSKFSQSSNSGDPIFYTDANGNNVIGTDIRNFQLETSNVAMESALTNLIIFQRAYDANSKTMTTADEMMQKALNMSA